MLLSRGFASPKNRGQLERFRTPCEKRSKNKRAIGPDIRGHRIVHEIRATLSRRETSRHSHTLHKHRVDSFNSLFRGGIDRDDLFDQTIDFVSTRLYGAQILLFSESFGGDDIIIQRKPAFLMKGEIN